MSNTSTTTPSPTTTPAPGLDEVEQDQTVKTFNTNAGEVTAAVGTPPPNTTVQLSVPAEFAGHVVDSSGPLPELATSGDSVAVAP